MELNRYLSTRRALVDRALKRFLPAGTSKPPTLHRAMRYSVFAGGKRLRPILCLAACEACGGTAADALPVASAIECIHTYSLIHDDLPCMDDDDFRRGKPTCHRAFGEGIAVLAGDALLTVAFEILCHCRPTPRHSLKNFLSELALASGSRRLIAGQVADLEGQGRKISREELRFIHESKTAALLTAALRLGGMSANATEGQIASLERFGRALGLAFQIIDDVLDVTQNSAKLGKSAGKDAAAQKATYPAFFGLEQSRRQAKRETKAALAALSAFGSSAATLKLLAGYLLDRDY